MISTKKTWQAQNEIWQAAVKERGDRAFELFEVETMPKWWVDLDSNDTAKKWIFNENTAWVRLKTIAELIKMDIQRYGDNAFLMYEWQIDDCTHPLINDCNYYPVESYDMIKSHIKAGNDVRRKLYADVPFNLEWAKAGVGIQCKNDDNVYVLIGGKAHVIEVDNVLNNQQGIK